MSAALNPIERRLEQLYVHWEAFAERDAARLLRWVVKGQDLRGVEAFFAAEDDERAGQLAVAFLRFEDPFEDPLAYAFTLRERVLEAIRLAELHAFAAPPPTGNALHDLFATCEALLREQGEALPMLALVLMPKAVADPRSWLAWLRAALARVPERVRLVVFDGQGAEQLDEFARAEPERVHSERVDLDLPGAAVEISREAGGLDQPQGRFRQAYAQMFEAIAKRDVAAAEQHALPALEIAKQAGWGHLEITVAFALGSAMLDAGRPQRAIELFDQADRRAQVGVEQGEPWGRGLRVKARLAMGAAAVMAAAWPVAATLYLDTAPLAREADDPRSELDCLRMAGYCRRNQGDADQAWVLGHEALARGEAMDAATRASSTLAFVGVDLLALARELGADETAIEQRMVAALGPDWRPTP